MPYDSTSGQWSPEDDSSANKLGGMLTAGSPYLDAAEATGQRQAAARGLQNSTMGTQSGTAAAIAAAQPFALADAASTAQKNLSFQGFGQQTALDAANNAATAQRQTADIGAQASRLNTQITSNEAIDSRDAQNKLALQQLSGDQQQKIAQMNVSANSQDKAENAAISASNIYTQNINAILGNNNIPSDARTQLMQNAQNELNANYSLIEQLYNIKLDWGTGTDTSNAIPSYGGEPNPTSQQQVTNNFAGNDTTSNSGDFPALPGGPYNL